MSLSDSLQLFFGAATPSLCRVYARCDGGADLQLVGSITGPSCLYGETLPASFPIVDRGPGPTRLAEAIVPEPSFWTPEMPELYRAELQLRRGREVIERVVRPFGIRPLGAAEGRLIFAGKNWVLRGVTATSPSVDDLPAWHGADTALVVASPSDVLCEAASRVGVLLVALVDEPSEREVRRLSRWPAVGFIVLPHDTPIGLNRHSGNTVLVQRLAEGENAAEWADAALVEAPMLERVASKLPLIAYRSGDAPTVSDGRRHCDRLQRELAGRGSFAGYLV